MMEKEYYEVSGKGNLILFIHGAGVTHKWWHPQTEYFLRNYQVITLDLPGHGRLSSMSFEMEKSIEHIETLVRKESSCKVFLLGISLGGYLSISYAERYPQSVAGLYLSGATINMNGSRGISFRLTGRMLNRRGPDWLEEVTTESYRKRVEASIIEPVIENGFYAKAAVEAFYELSGKNFHRMMETYGGPIMIGNGENDEPNRKAEKTLQKRVKNIKIDPIKGASHLANLEKPDEFNASLQRFAEEISWNAT